MSGFVSVRVLLAAFVLVMASVVAQEERPQLLQKLQEPLTDITLENLYQQMNDDAAVKFHVDCVTNKGPCDNIGKALESLLRDNRAKKKICYRCDKCQNERVQYVLDTLKTKHRDLACQVQNEFDWIGLFGNTNPCP